MHFLVVSMLNEINQSKIKIKPPVLSKSVYPECLLGTLTAFEDRIRITFPPLQPRQVLTKLWRDTICHEDIIAQFIKSMKTSPHPNHLTDRYFKICIKIWMFKIHDKPLCLILEWLAVDQLSHFSFYPHRKSGNRGPPINFRKLHQAQFGRSPLARGIKYPSPVIKYFQQTTRYNKHTWHGLFYVSLFV